MSDDLKLGGGLLLAAMDFDPAHEAEINRWYDEEHFPERLAVPGVLWGRRYRAIEGAPRYLALYGLESPAVLDAPEYLRIRPASEWQNRVVTGHTSNLQRSVYADITPAIPVGYEVRAVRR